MISGTRLPLRTKISIKAADMASQAIRRSRRSRAGIVSNIVPHFPSNHIYLLLLADISHVSLAIIITRANSKKRWRPHTRLEWESEQYVQLLSPQFYTICAFYATFVHASHIADDTKTYQNRYNTIYL